MVQHARYRSLVDEMGYRHLLFCRCPLPDTRRRSTLEKFVSIFGRIHDVNPDIRASKGKTAEHRCSFRRQPPATRCTSQSHANPTRTRLQCLQRNQSKYHAGSERQYIHVHTPSAAWARLRVVSYASNHAFIADLMLKRSAKQSRTTSTVACNMDSSQTHVGRRHGGPESMTHKSMTTRKMGR